MKKRLFLLLGLGAMLFPQGPAAAREAAPETPGFSQQQEVARPGRKRRRDRRRDRRDKKGSPKDKKGGDKKGSGE